MRTVHPVERARCGEYPTAVLVSGTAPRSRLESGQQFGPIASVDQGAVGAFKAAHAIVGIHPDHQKIGLAPGRLEGVQMAHVNQVKAAVGEGDAQPSRADRFEPGPKRTWSTQTASLASRVKAPSSRVTPTASTR